MTVDRPGDPGGDPIESLRRRIDDLERRVARLERRPDDDLVELPLIDPEL